MRSIWLLPDREQTGVIKAVENEKIKPLHELLKISELPSELNLGIPEELIRAKKAGYFVFGQFAKLENGKKIFCLSAPAGDDITGRLVSISNLQLLESHEEPDLSISIPHNISSKDSQYIKTMLSTTSQKLSATSQSIKLMLEAVKDNGWEKTYASELLKNASNKPDWMPKKKLNSGFKRMGAPIVIVIIFIIVLLYLLKNTS